MPYNATVLVISSAPSSLSSWPLNAKIARAEAKLAWHKYIRELNARKKVPWTWGSHALTAGFTSSPYRHTLVSIYDCDGLEEFSSLLERDPLFDTSEYITVPIRSLPDDARDDAQAGPNTYEPPAAGTPGGILANARRGLFRSAPGYADVKPPAVPNPPNLPTDLDAKYDGTVSYLLYGTAPDEYVNWDDQRREITGEKVGWWHQYAANLVTSGQLTHGWAIQPFCHTSQEASYRKGGMVVLQAPNLDELQTAYESNPLIDEARFVSVALRPLSEQQKADEAHVQALKTRV